MAFTLIVSVNGNNSSCGSAKPPTVADCDHSDLGSCGNSCCVVDIHSPYSLTEVAYLGLKTYLKGGGDDGSYSYVTGAGSGGQNPSDNLTAYNIPGDYEYILQGTHSTTGGYVDTIDFNIRKSGAGSILRGASRSGIHGALGDNGQNYKTLALLKSQIYPEKEVTLTIVYGCGK